MPLETINILLHIKEELDFVLSDSKQYNYQSFVNDKKAVNSYCRSLEIIGEASKQLPEEFKSKYPQTDWKGFAGLRDIIIHQYFGIDYEIIWETINSELPEMHVEINRILELESNN